MSIDVNKAEIEKRIYQIRRGLDYIMIQLLNEKTVGTQNLLWLSEDMTKIIYLTGGYNSKVSNSSKAKK